MRAELDAQRELEALTSDVRGALIQHWLRRSSSEWRVGLAFAALAPLAKDLAEPIVVQMLESSAAQELKHAERCHAMAERYAAATLAQAERPAAPLPDFRAETPALELTLQLVGMCCINETLATAWLRHCLQLATVPFAIQANREHLRDEIDHARLGWAHLASARVSAEDKLRVAARLPSLLRVNLEQWEEPRHFLPGEALAAHGQPSAESSRIALREAVSAVLLPGFAHVGISMLSVPLP